MQSKDRCNKIKTKTKNLINKHNTKMRIGMYTKQIGNCLDNLVLSKQVPRFMKTLSNEIVKKEKQFSPKVKYHKSHKLGKECHVKFYNHTLVRHMMSIKHYQLNRIASISSKRTICVELSLKFLLTFPAKWHTYLPENSQIGFSELFLLRNQMED